MVASRSKRRTPPSWPAIQRAEDEGRTLISLWREHAAIADQPYALSSFRKWQAQAPENPAEEYASSDRYWQGRTLPRPDILVLGDGATLRARGGRLEASLPSPKLTHTFDPGPHHRKPKAIIFAGWGGIITIHAVRFCIDHHITVLATGWLGDLLAFISPRPTQDASLVRRQCTARPAHIARNLVLQKFRHYLATRRMTRPQFRDFEARLIAAHRLDTILTIEAVGSSLSWAPWSGLRLIPRTGRTLPTWLSRPFQQRASGLGGHGARHATDPINAMLNLAYAKEAGRLGAMLAASGACLAIGYLHFDRPHRHSLVFDALEPLRPLIDAKVRAFIEGNTFDRGDFLRLSTGHVRMVGSLIRVVLEQTALPVSDIMQAQSFVLSLVRDANAARTRSSLP